MQSYGQLIGVVLMDYIDLAIVFSLVVKAILTLINGYFLETEGSNANPFIVHMSRFAALKFVLFGLLNSIYILDRCDWQNEFSLVVNFFKLELDNIAEYFIRILINIVIIRLITLLVMNFKFRMFLKGNSVNEIILNKKKVSDKAIEIDSGQCSLNMNNISTKDEFTYQLEEDKIDYFSIQKRTLEYKIILAWRNLNLFGSSSLFQRDTKCDDESRIKILDSLNGQLLFGTLNAVMGTSGAGKTSLLRVLNGQCKTRLSKTTRWYLSSLTKIDTCFITQEVSNHLITGLTVFQSMIYASRLKNIGSKIDHEKNVFSVLNQLDLYNTANTKLERCSGGEKKRLALAAELTALIMPNLICIDEPTSGLDSKSAEIVSF